MKLIIFGATGTIGQHLVEQALSNGYEVTAFARNPSKLDVENSALEIVQGDVMEPEHVSRAMLGHEVVVIALGAGAKGGIRSQGTRNVIQGMQSQGINRLICLSSLGVGESHRNLNFFWKYLMFGMLLRKAYADHVAQEQAIRESGLEWTIVRPGAFTDGPATGTYKCDFPPTETGLKFKISRADVADFMLQQIGDDTYLRQSPGLSY